MDPRPGDRAHRHPPLRGPSPRARDPAPHLEWKASPRRGASAAAGRRAAFARSRHPAPRREGDRALLARADAGLMHDVAIAGGGPAGLAAAIRAAQRGFRTVVFERSHAVPDKACGEGLMPSGARELERLGIRIAEDRCASFRGIRYLQEDGTVLEARFGTDAGIGIRRTALGEALRDRALASGVDLRHGTVTGATALRDGETKDSFEELLGRFPALRERLGEAGAESEVRGAGPLLQRVRARSGERLVLIGDAAGYVDAITGQGLSLAFAASAVLMEALPDDLSADLRPAFERYEAGVRARWLRYALPAHALVALSRRPRLRRSGLRSMARFPSAFGVVVRIVD